MTNSKNSLVTTYSPVSHWRLSEASGATTVDSAGTSDGVVNGASLGVTGVFDGTGEAAVAFDGQNDYIEMAHDPVFSGLSDGTMQLWFNTNRLNKNQGLFTKDSSGFDNGGQFRVWLTTDGRLGVRSESSNNKRILYTAPGELGTNQWHHVSVSWGSGGLRLYLDGAQVSSASGWTTGWQGNSEPIVLGADQRKSGNQQANNLLDFFSGEIDDVALFNRALTGNEIQQLYQAGTGGSITPPVNTAPIAQNDTGYAIASDQSLVVNASNGVLTNDSDADGDTLTVTGGTFATVSGGSIVLATDGSFSYTAASGFTGVDEFVYTVEDGEGGVSTATIEITVTSNEPGNQVPVVDAGNDETIATLAWVGQALSGSVTDDSASLSTQWIQEDGPGVAIFDDASDLDTKVTFSQAGSYVLQLVADDGEHQVMDQVTITVNRPTTNLMPLGDSITQGRYDYDSYRRLLWQELNAQGHDVDFVGSQTQNYRYDPDLQQIVLAAPPNPDFDLDHEGHSGWRADELLNGSVLLGDGVSNISLWANTYDPDLVLLHAGTNDILQAVTQDSASNSNINTIINNVVNSTIQDLENIVDALRNANPNVGILIAQLIPVEIPSTGNKVLRQQKRAAAIGQLNTKILQVFPGKDQSGSPVRVVDQASGFIAATDTYDGLHPDVSGEQKLADRWSEAIEDIAYFGNDHFGRGKIDQLTGQAQVADKFVLGDFGDAYYNDGVLGSNGLGDYALIQNFQAGSDQIQLVGSSSDYLTAASPIGAVTGTAIYWDINQSGVSGAELIGVVKEVSSLNLDSDQFVYV